MELHQRPSSYYTLGLLFLVGFHSPRAEVLPSRCSETDPKSPYMDIQVLHPSRDAIVDKEQNFTVVANGIDVPLERIDIFDGSEHLLSVGQLDFTLPDSERPNKIDFSVPILIGREEKRSLSLQPGRQTTLTVVGWDSAGRCSEHSHQLQVVSSRVYAIVVGIREYKYFRDLAYSDSDATRFRSYLVDELLVPPGNIRTLLNDEALFRNIRTEFDTLEGVIEPNDTLILYYSGHGYLLSKTVPEPEGPRSVSKGYLIPYDAEINKTGTYLERNWLVEKLSESGAKRRVFFFDACYTGAGQAGAKTISGTSTSERQWQDGLKAVSLVDQWPEFVGTYGMYSSKLEEPSWELTNIEETDVHGSVFTHYLLESFTQSHDIDNNGLISLLEAYPYVNAKVKSEVRRQKEIVQDPQLYQNDEGIDAMHWGTRQKEDKK